MPTGLYSTADRSSGTCCSGYSSWGGRRKDSGSSAEPGDFDGIGQFSTKESIGRKYQWIAYHEVLGLISDHFQYREYPAEEERSHRYVGPWQNGLRDIDPTLTATLPGGGPWCYYLDSADVWWATEYDRWDDTDTLENWVRRHDDLERFEKLLIVRNPGDGTRWLTGNVDLSWAQKPPVGRNAGSRAKTARSCAGSGRS